MNKEKTMAEKTLRQLMKDVVNKPTDETARAALRARVGDVACFMMKDGALDIEESVDAFEFVREYKEEISGALTAGEWLRALAPQADADPITGRALFKGRTVDGFKVDWSALPRERRLVAAFAAESGQLPLGATSETVVEALLEEIPRAPWPRLIAEWTALCASTKPADRARVLGIEARLTFSREAPRSSAPFAGDVVPTAVAVISMTAPAADALSVHVIASQGDQRHLRRFVDIELSRMRRDGFVRVTGAHELGPGADTRGGLARMCAAADIFVILISADTLASCHGEIEAALDAQARRGARIIPVLVRQTLLEPALERLISLPRNGRAIMSSSDPDEMWAEVSLGFRAVVQAMRLKK